MGVIKVALSAAVAFGAATDLKVDPGKLGDAPATLILEPIGLDRYRTIPLLQRKYVTVTLSAFPGCPEDPQQLPQLTELAAGVLTPKRASQTVPIPGDTDLAIVAETTEQGGGNTLRCALAMRFHSESGVQYRLRIDPDPRSCRISFSELRDGRELPVHSAHLARLTPTKLLSGGELNVCAERDSPEESATTVSGSANLPAEAAPPP